MSEKRTPRVTVTLITADKPCNECVAAKGILASLASQLPGVEIQTLSRSDPDAERYGVVLTPVVVVDGLIFSMGRRPPARRLESFLKERCGVTGSGK